MFVQCTPTQAVSKIRDCDKPMASQLAEVGAHFNNFNNLKERVTNFNRSKKVFRVKKVKGKIQD